MWLILILDLQFVNNSFIIFGSAKCPLFIYLYSLTI